jgi:excisionase family DNA binding protein
MIGDDWMTLQEAGAKLGVSPLTLRRQAQLGQLAAVKRGRDWMTTTAAVDAYRAEHKGRVGRPKKTVEPEG